jgi:hypothetical protein
MVVFWQNTDVPAIGCFPAESTTTPEAIKFSVWPKPAWKNNIINAVIHFFIKYYSEV